MGTLQRPLTERLHRAMGGAPVGGFGSVSMPGTGLETEVLHPLSGPHIQERDMGAPAPEQEPILMRLAKLRPASPELQTRLRAMVSDLATILTEAQELEQAIITERKGTLKEQWDSIRAEGRRQQRVCAQLRQNLADAELALMNVAAQQEGVLNALRGLKVIEQKGQHVRRFASDSEIAAWDDRVREAKAQVTAANQEAVEALQKRNQAMLELEPAHKELARISAEEIRIRAELNDQPYTDPEFGLSSVPAGVAR